MAEDSEKKVKDASTSSPSEQSKGQNNSSTKSPAQKASSKKKGKKKPSNTKAKRKSVSSTPVKAKMPRLFPAITLEEALKIPYAIKVKNGGNPLENDLVAKAVD